MGPTRMDGPAGRSVPPGGRLRSLLIGAALGATAFFAGGPAHATFSIVALDPETGELGVAVQSRAFSVGGGVPWAEAGVGAIATQAMTNESFGPRGLALMRTGLPADQVLQALLVNDPERERRQVGLVDPSGWAVAHTGSGCSPWAGDTTLPGLSIQGNILASAEVIREMLRAFQESDGELAERLLASLKAAQVAGGDRRGQQSAALLVVRPSEHFPEYRTRYIDLRVEDHVEPIEELERVFRIHEASDLLRAHLRYAALYDSTGRPEAALRERQRVGQTMKRRLAAGEADASTLNSLAWFTATSGLYLEEALTAAERAAELEPESTEILDTLAEVWFRLGERERALEVIGRARRLSPDDPYLKGQEARFEAEPIPPRR